MAFMCSWLIVTPTVGISGMVFAAIGFNLGEKRMWKGLLKCAFSAVLFGLTPGVSMLFHVMCLFVGFVSIYLWRPLK